MKQLAIIKNVGFGCRDMCVPVLYFNTFISECETALQIIEYPRYISIITDYKVFDVKDLENKPCWVDVNNTQIIFSDCCGIK